MLIATFYSFRHGDPWKLIAPIDGDNHVCGYPNTDGKDMTGYPYLFIGEISTVLSPDFDKSKQSLFDYGVCVKQCPTENKPDLECVGTANVPDCNAPNLTTYVTYKVLGYCVPEYSSLPDDLKPQYELAEN